MDNIAGSPVEGDNFFGRDAELATLRDILVHDDLLLLGPRRIGKTSIARAIMAAERASGRHAVEINVASCTDERMFLHKLEGALMPELASLTTKFKSAIGDAMGQIGQRVKSVKLPVPGGGGVGVELQAAPVEDWTQVANDLLRLLTKADKPWLVYIDELPIFLFTIIRADPTTGVQRVRRFLDWFRNDVRALPDANRIRWLVSGSVGLDTLVQQHGMADTINSLRHATLAPFSDEMAIAMLRKLAERYVIALTEADAGTMVTSIHWAQPYYLQATFSHLRALIGTNPSLTLANLIDRAVDMLAEPKTDNDFHHWEGRLALQLPKSDAYHARAMLTLAAAATTGARAERLFDVLQERMPHATREEALQKFVELRDILERDAYWWPDESTGQKRYRFRLEPLRRWWVRRNSL